MAYKPLPTAVKPKPAVDPNAVVEPVVEKKPKASRKKVPYYKTDAGKAAHRKSNLKRLYQITPALYQEMFEGQNGRCAICARHRDEFVKDFVVDHHHGTGAVRALLCPACNTAIGLFGDNPATLERAATYIRESGKEAAADESE